MEISQKNYRSGPGFELNENEALLHIDPTDSTELWLIQLPLHQLQPADFNGKEIKVKERDENLLASFESLSGKSYEVTISEEKELDVAACLGPELIKNISRTVSIVHYPEPEEYEKTQGANTINLSTIRTKGSMKKPRKSASKNTTAMKNSVSKISHEETQVSAPKSGQGSISSSHSHKKKKHEGTNESLTSGSKSEQSKSEKKKKVKLKVEED